MAEFDILPSPVRNRQRLDLRLNPAQNINYTVFIPPSVTNEQYIIPDRTVGIAIGTVELLGSATLSILGNGTLAVL